MKEVINYFTYLLFRAFVFLFRFIPFRVMYFISDGLYHLFYHVVRYRRDVVFMNLRNSFPEKNDEELTKIAKGFYHHLCDVLLESVKSSGMKELDVAARYKLLHPEMPNAYYQQGRPLIAVAGHFNNWEWGGIATGSQMLHKPVGFYKPLSNVYLDRYVQRTRIQGRSDLASITRTTETFNIYKGEPAVFYMVSDQSPSSPRLAYWVKFMNQDTATLHGPEKYARLHNYPVVYVDVQKVERGRYTFEFILLADDPKSLKTGEITQRFMKMLEDKIREHPEYYLWSHRRWKLKKELK